MPLVVPATEAQKDLLVLTRESHGRAGAGREALQESGYIVSAETFHELWSSYRRRMEVRGLTDGEMAMIMAAEVPAEHACELEDLEADDPDQRVSPAHGM